MGMAQQMSLGMITAIQPIFAGGRILNGNRLADLGVAMVGDKAELTRRSALQQTEEKYWRLVTLAEKKKTLAAYDSLLATIEKQVADARKSGLITSNDELKVAVQRSRVEADAERLSNGIRLAQRDLIHHIGLPEDSTIIIVDTLAVPENPAELEKLKDGAVGRRPELMLLNKVSRAEHLQTQLKIGEMLPMVSIGGSLLALNVQGMDGSLNAMVIGMVNIPISNIWEGVYNVDSQRAREKMAELRYRDTDELLRIQIDKAWDDLRSAWRMSQVADKGVVQAEENLKEANDRQVNGLAPVSDVLEAQVIMRQALDNRTDSRSDYWLRRSEYMHSVVRE
jgi:outer membrane protein TolC